MSTERDDIPRPQRQTTHVPPPPGADPQRSAPGYDFVRSRAQLDWLCRVGLHGVATEIEREGREFFEHEERRRERRNDRT